MRQTRTVHGIAILAALAIACGNKGGKGDAGDDTSVPDGDESEAGDVVGDCVPVGEEECNGADDDCDGDVDEDFDLSTDIENCGACGFTCEVPNGTPVCDAGTCSVASCEDGFIDLNGAVLDGCEYECTVGAPQESVEDGSCEDDLDNDCDGRVDAEDPDCAECVPELCDGADNDCDELVDEDFDLISDVYNCGTCRNACPPRLHGSPVCVRGECTVVCEEGWRNDDGDDVNGCEAACVPDTVPDETDCDGSDSDCDGLVDEDYVPHTCGEGYCEAESICWGGVDDCEPLDPLTLDDRTCDGVDDDCDGTADEEYIPTSACIGLCRDTATCMGGDEDCGTPAPDDHTCDYEDDDCNGEYDEDYEAYTCGSGACIRSSTCIMGVEDCDEGGSSPEVCNGSDDDCNDSIDDGDPSVLCAPVPAHATPSCDLGVCVLASCETGWRDVDGVYANGCECEEETTESSSTACPGHSLGTLHDEEMDSAIITGKLAHAGDVDWYTFQAADQTDPSSHSLPPGLTDNPEPVYCDHFKVSIRFTVNPDAPGTSPAIPQFRMDIFKGICTSAAVCSGENAYEYGVNMHCSRTVGGVTTWYGECEYWACSTSCPVTNDASSYYVKVYRTPGTAVTCDEYQIEVRNGAAAVTTCP